MHARIMDAIVVWRQRALLSLRNHRYLRPPENTGACRTARDHPRLQRPGVAVWLPACRPLTPGQPERILCCLDAGINYIDIAGLVRPKRIGRCISSRRQEFYLASKCGCPLDVSQFTPSERTRFGVPLPRLHDYSRQHIMDAVNQSLRRLQTDYIDLVQFHFSPAREVLEHEGAIETLHDLQRAGKVRFLGCSSILPNLTDHIAMGVFDVLQIPYSALQPEHEAAIADAARGGAGIVIRGGVARGEPGPGQGSATSEDLGHARMDELLEAGRRWSSCPLYAHQP